MPVKGTHLKTPVIKLGQVSLYEPRVFKPMQGEDEKNQSVPKYEVNMVFDKVTDKKFILANKKAVKAARDYAIKLEEWDEDQLGDIAFRDADKDKVQESMTSKKKIILAEKRPALRGKFSLSAKTAEDRPPTVRYLDKNGIIRPMPEPILDPNPDDPDEVAKSERIKKFWRKTVFPGQYANVSYTYKHWTVGKNQGIKAELKNILIIGGGIPAGSVAFEEDFSTDDLAQLVAWRNANVPNFRMENDPWSQPQQLVKPDDGEADDDVEDDYDDETDESSPKKTSVKRRKPVYDEDEDVDVEDDEDEDYAEEEEEKPQPRTSKTSKRRKPVEPEPEPDEDEDYDEEDDDEDYDDVF